MNFCLSDLVPPLRWSDASTITLLTGQPDLPDAWWRSLPMPHVLAAIGPESLGELLTEIALEHWPAAAVGDVLPALHVLDPEEADEPAVAIALDRAGSWIGLLGVTSRELVDQPFIQARPVLNTLFSAVFARMAHPRTAVPAEPAAPSVAAPQGVTHVPSGSALAAEPALADAPSHGVGPSADPVADEPEIAAQEGARAAHAMGAPEAAQAMEAAEAEAGAEQLAAHEGVASHEGAPAAAMRDDAAHDTADAAESAGEVAAGAGDPVAGADEIAADAGEAGPGAGEIAPGEGEAVADEAAGAELGAAVSGEGGPEALSHEDAADQRGAAEEGEPEGAEPVLDADAEPVVEEGDGPESVLDAAEDPAPQPAAEEAAALADSERPEDADALDASAHREDADALGADADAKQADAQDADAQEDADALEAGAQHEDAGAPDERARPEGARVPEDGAGDRQESLEAGAWSEGPAERPEPEAESGEQRPELPELIEAAFAGLDDKSWAVAQNRVFTDEPSAVDQLAKLFAVPPAEISATEQEFRTRLSHWLASEEAAPYRAHLDELRRTLGPAAPKEQLIGAADWHKMEIRALEVPAWQFVLATLPPQPRQQPPVELPPPPAPQMDLPPPPAPQSAFGPVPPPPPPAPPGPPQFQAFTPVTPPSGESNGGTGEHKPYQPLKDVSQTRRCFRQPDGRWWLRIDVTAEQLAGGECALPTGFASYLGLSPGESKAVRSAAGELTMTWHGRPVLENIERLLMDVGAREGGHLFLTLSDEGVLRARHLPVAAQGAEKITKALRLVGYTAPGGTRDQAARVIATRIGMTGPVSLPDLLTRLRERGDRDLLALLD